MPLDMYYEAALGLIAGVSGHGPRWLSAIGRLKSGAELRTARAQIETIGQRTEPTYAANQTGHLTEEWRGHLFICL